jgi:hypothetical protein
LNVQDLGSNGVKNSFFVRQNVSQTELVLLIVSQFISSLLLVEVAEVHLEVLRQYHLGQVISKQTFSLIHNYQFPNLQSSRTQLQLDGTKWPATILRELNAPTGTC